MNHVIRRSHRCCHERVGGCDAAGRLVNHTSRHLSRETRRSHHLIRGNHRIRHPIRTNHEIRRTRRPIHRNHTSRHRIRRNHDDANRLPKSPRPLPAPWSGLPPPKVLSVSFAVPPPERKNVKGWSAVPLYCLCPHSLGVSAWDACAAYAA